MPYILVVEDDLDGREVLHDWIETWGYDCVSVEDAESAIDVLSQRGFDMVVMDLALPGIDGMALLEYVRTTQALSNIPCIAITAFDNNSVRHHTIEAGFDAYLPKPINEDALHQQVNQLLGT